jgi:hypothetical protein
MTEQQHHESDDDTELEAEVATTLAAIRALTDVQERMRINFEREREKFASTRSARVPRTSDERAACLRALRLTLQQVVLALTTSGLLFGLLLVMPALTRWIDGVLGR